MTPDESLSALHLLRMAAHHDYAQALDVAISLLESTVKLDSIAYRSRVTRLLYIGKGSPKMCVTRKTVSEQLVAMAAKECR